MTRSAAKNSTAAVPRPVITTVATFRTCSESRNLSCAWTKFRLVPSNRCCSMPSRPNTWTARIAPIVCSISDVRRLMCSRLSCDVRWMRPVRRWIVKNSSGSTASEMSVSSGSSSSMKTTMIIRRKKRTAQVRIAEDHHFLDAAGVVDRPPDGVADGLVGVKAQRERAHVAARDASAGCGSSSRAVRAMA